jgi:hypothetical protein
MMLQLNDGVFVAEQVRRQELYAEAKRAQLIAQAQAARAPEPLIARLGRTLRRLGEHLEGATQAQMR